MKGIVGYIASVQVIAKGVLSERSQPDAVVSNVSRGEPNAESE